MMGKPMATHVAQTLEYLYERAEAGEGPEGLLLDQKFLQHNVTCSKLTSIASTSSTVHEYR